MSHSDAAAVNVALLVLRVVLGILFLAHGGNHILGGGRSGTSVRVGRAVAFLLNRAPGR